MSKDNTNANNAVIDAALAYKALGFSVIPLGEINYDSEGKKKIIYLSKWKENQTTQITNEGIKEWSCENLGIVTGRTSGILVLDLDRYKENYDRELEQSFELPITPTSQTTSGGTQLFFKLPDGLVIKNKVCIGHKGSGIDIRAEGGMVVVPPSKTPHGEYTWLIDPFDTPLAQLPPKLFELLTQKTKEGSEGKKKLSELVGLKEGEGRNNAMTSFVGKLLRKTDPDHWDDEVWPMLEAVNNTHKPPLQKEELFRVYQSIAKIEKERRSKLPKNKKEDNVLSFMPAITHAELISKEFPPSRFTVDPFFEQGTMNMVSAPPNTWKSWLLFLFAGNIAVGTPVFDKFSTEKANVMIVSEEDSHRLIQDRLKLLKITDITLPIFYRIAQGSKLTDQFVDNLIKESREKNIGVIMFDSLRAIHEADENDSTAMQAVMDLLKKIARANITVIFTHHHKKKNTMGKNDDAESSRGSTAINAAINGHISLEEVNKDDDRYLIVKHLKSKVGEKLPPFDLGIQTGTAISFKYLGEHKPKIQALIEAKTRILSELQEREELLSRKDFVYLKVAGETTIKQATKALELEKRIKVFDRKEAEKSGLRIFSPGKSNEKLYCLRKDEDIDMFEDLHSEDT